ncbi:MAG: aminotransferase class V-fold PLP-dependent enzyme [Thermoanaerobaculum sp.]
MELSQIFPIRERCLYLDHAEEAPLPQPVVAAVARLLANFQEEGFWDPRVRTLLENKVRALVAQVLACQPTDVRLFPSTTAGLTALLAAVELPGTTVFLATEASDGHPFPVGQIERLGYSVTVLAPTSWQMLPSFLEKALPTQAVVVLPWVDATGWVGELEVWVPALKDRGCLVVLDAAQAVPCRPETFPELEVDALLVPSHTWLLGPRGGIALVAGSEFRQRESFPPAPGQPTPKLLGLDRVSSVGEGIPPLVAAGWAAALELLLLEGLVAVRNRVLAHQRTLTAQLLALGWEVGSPGASHPVAGIVVAKHPFFPASEVQRRLQLRHVRVGTYGDWVRFSPHFYTTVAELAALEKILGTL